MVLPVVGEVPLRLIKVLGETHPQAPTIYIMEVDGNGNFVTQEMESHPGFTTARNLFCHGSVRLFKGMRSVPSTSMKRELSPSDVPTARVNMKNRVV